MSLNIENTDEKSRGWHRLGWFVGLYCASLVVVGGFMFLMHELAVWLAHIA